MVRQVRLELTIPCLRGRCLDPIWLLTHGGTERTRTVIDLIDNQVPHLSATVPNIADFQLPIADLCFGLRSLVFGFCRLASIGNRQSKIGIAFGVTCGVEPSSLHSQCSVLTNYTKATANFW